MFDTSVPNEITNELREFVAQVVGEQAEPFFIAITATKDAEPKKCHAHTAAQVKAHGGEVVYCWSLWESKPLWLEATFHSLWRDEQGELHDLTPDEDGESKRLVVLDSNRKFDGHALPKQFHLLTDHPAAKEALSLIQAQEKIATQYKAGEQFSQFDVRRTLALQASCGRLILSALASINRTTNRFIDRGELRKRDKARKKARKAREKAKRRNRQKPR